MTGTKCQVAMGRRAAARTAPSIGAEARGHHFCSAHALRIPTSLPNSAAPFSRCPALPEPLVSVKLPARREVPRRRLRRTGHCPTTGRRASRAGQSRDTCRPCVSRLVERHCSASEQPISRRAHSAVRPVGCPATITPAASPNHRGEPLSCPHVVRLSSRFRRRRRRCTSDGGAHRACCGNR